MNESQVRNLTPQELVNAFECGQLSDENIKQAFAMLAVEFESAVSGEESNVEKVLSLEEEVSELEDRVNELEDIVSDALDCDDYDSMVEELNKA